MGDRTARVPSLEQLASRAAQPATASRATLRRGIVVVVDAMSRSALNFALKRQLATGGVPSSDPYAEVDAWQPDEDRLASSAYEL